MRRRALAVLLPLACTAACTAPAAEVTGPFGARPTVVLPAEAADPAVRVVLEGDGPEIGPDDLAVVHYAAYYAAHVRAGGAARTADSTFARGAPTAVVPPALAAALPGHRVGSRLLVTPPRDRPAAPVYVADLLGRHAAGASLDAGGGELHGVRVSGGARPVLRLPPGPPPGRFAAVVLSRGGGPAASAGRLLVAQYEGVAWDGGRSVGSTWRAGRPAAFTVGDGGVIAGWDHALLGVPAGSRVLMIVPPADGYGASGHPPLGVGPGETLVYVMDVLAVY
ncbi:FKBP-type peptidyl-prolyl cis-trans isomerase [Nonomuraea ceibae]|uniref:FKBP-type peptidyl-prolyl cis-trans isomerase n=1 Tax=Nonomuraea ceibae TaxID=1935170 RepID=UPI001C5F590C|nr:FKBP-type peptidyl-prolyl cis-trans isomerase [Nonomuraea ceibae]